MFDKYPRAQELIEKHNYEDSLLTTPWVRFDQEEAAIALAKVILTQKSLNSSAIHLRAAAKKQVDTDYLSLDNKLHVFAKEEARSELELTNEDVTRIFSHIEIGGNRYR